MSRASAQKRIRELEAFVAAWDAFIVASALASKARAKPEADQVYATHAFDAAKVRLQSAREALGPVSQLTAAATGLPPEQKPKPRSNGLRLWHPRS